MGDVFLEGLAIEYTAAGFIGEADELIPLLQYIQKKTGYISANGAESVARFLGLSAARVYAVASFYAQFRFHPPGEHHVRVCLGTACHVQGGGELSREAQDSLGIRAGETTSDGRFDLEEVACLGCCAQAAVVEVDGKIHARMSPEDLHRLLEQHGRA
jgi:NADH-quinone oxidoreductase subunit E